MIYLALILFSFSPPFSSDSISAVTDSITVFKDESYLELDPNYVDIRNITTAFNPVNDHVYAYDKNSGGVLWEFKPDGSISALDTLHIAEINKMMPMDIPHSGESIWLWEQGLGKVFEYTFSDSSLKQIDRTRVQDLMVGHGSIITEDERILAQGGYGFWEFRNFLLEFNPVNGEWSKIDVEGDIPVTPYTYNFLGHLKNENLLVYVFVPLTAVEQTSKSAVRTFEPFFEIYTLDLETSRWTHRNTIYPRDTDLGFRKRPRSRATHSIDYSRGTFVFNGRLSLNTNTFELFYIFHPSVKDMWSSNFYYSKNSDRWIVIGRNSDVSKQHIIVRSFPASEARLSPVEEELSAHIVWIGWFLGGFIALALVFAGIKRLKNKMDKEERSASKKIELTGKNGELSAVVGGDRMDLSDPIFKEFFMTVYDMKKQEKSEILMSEFDNMIFTDQHSQPYRSKMKNKIFKLVNTKFDQPVINIDVYPLDKRYKMIVLNLNTIKIDNTPVNS